MKKKEEIEEFEEEIIDDEILDEEIEEVEELEDEEPIKPKKEKKAKEVSKKKLSKKGKIAIISSSSFVGVVAIALITIFVILPFAGLDLFAKKANRTHIVYSSTYSELKLGSNTDSWRDGMVGGNGKIGFLTNGSPASDVITYQHIDYLMPTNADRDDVPTASTSVEELRQKIVNMEEPVDGDTIDIWQRISKYHPGMQLRIDTALSSEASKYQRYTCYDTAEVGETFNDGSVEWERKTFASREDDVIITAISNSKNDVNITISIDTASKMIGFGKGSNCDQTDEKNIQYKEIVSDDATYLAQVVHYPDYANSTYKEGGYAAVTYIIIDKGTKTAKKEQSTDSYNKNGYDAAVEITGAKNVYLITALDKTKEMGKMSAFSGQDSYTIEDELLQKVQSVSDKYKKFGKFSYDKALEPSAKIQDEIFNAASLDITDSEEEQYLTNEEYISAQRKSKTLSPSFSNRVYNHGRYVMTCCAGYSMSRLSGMWIGTWDPGWRYIYTMDANVNLQSSGMNTSNIQEFGNGYIRFVHNQLADWETNAKVIYNIDDAILCPPHADGDRAINDEGNLTYPFQYWNAGAAWMIQPIYEYYQCYGNATIETADGNKDLLNDILIPMLEKNANFWLGLCVPQYYTDASGNARYDASKTSLASNEKYLIVPSYSPENWTIGSYESTLAVNCAMDISAARYSLEMAIELENLQQPSGYAAKVEKYQALLDKLPDYQYTSSGAVKEWCANGYEDNNAHRHLSHLYLAWPAFETQSDETLYNAALQSLADRDKGSTASQSMQSHGWLHKALVAARLKDSAYVTNCLYTMFHTSVLGSRGLFYNSMMTNHDIDGGSNAYCTDSALGLIGVMNEALLYSNNGEIGILPALPTTWKHGSYKNLRARTRATVSCTWSESGVSCSITSDIAQTIKVTYKNKTENVTFAAGETKTFTF